MGDYFDDNDLYEDDNDDYENLSEEEIIQKKERRKEKERKKEKENNNKNNENSDSDYESYSDYEYVYEDENGNIIDIADSVNNNDNNEENKNNEDNEDNKNNEDKNKNENNNDNDNRVLVRRKVHKRHKKHKDGENNFNDSEETVIIDPKTKMEIKIKKKKKNENNDLQQNDNKENEIKNDLDEITEHPSYIKEEDDRKPKIKFNPERYMKKKETIQIIKEYEENKEEKEDEKKEIVNEKKTEEKVKEKEEDELKTPSPIKNIPPIINPKPRVRSANTSPKSIRDNSPKNKNRNKFIPKPPLSSRTENSHIRRVSIKFNPNEDKNKSPLPEEPSFTVPVLSQEEINKIKLELELRENEAVREDYEKQKKVKTRLNGLFETLEMPIQSRLDFIVKYSNTPKQEHLLEVLAVMENVYKIYIIDFKIYNKKRKSIRKIKNF